MSSCRLQDTNYRNLPMQVYRTQTIEISPCRLQGINEGTVVEPQIKYDPRDNYKIDDLSSGEETDEESKPKRTVPKWAKDKLGKR